MLQTYVKCSFCFLLLVICSLCNEIQQDIGCRYLRNLLSKSSAKYKTFIIIRATCFHITLFVYLTNCKAGVVKY